MPRLVECCIHNLIQGGQKTLENCDDTVRYSFCLDRCGTCDTDQFLVIDGELRVGRSHHRLLHWDEKGE